jgi:hypothetical protein
VSELTTQDSTIEAQVASFVPKSLDPNAWAIAREAVLEAVLSWGPASPRDAVVKCSRVCGFLAWLPTQVWDRQQAPDLKALLTESRIREFTSAAGVPNAKPWSRRGYRSALMALRRCLGTGRSVPTPKVQVKASRSSAAFWPAVAGMGRFTVLALACRSSGGCLHATSWYGLTDRMVVDLTVLPTAVSGTIGSSGATARPSVPGSVEGIQALAAALRDATAPPSGGDPTMPTSDTASPHNGSPRTGAAASARRPTRAAALRAARAAHEVSASAAPAASAPGVAGVKDLPEELAALLTGWTPQGMDEQTWAPIRDAVKAAVCAFGPPSAIGLRNCRSIVVGFAQWVYTRPTRQESGNLEPAEFLADGLVDAYLAGPLAGRPDGSRATARAVLRRVAANLDPAGPPEKIAYQPVQPPYTPAECARLVTLARNQPTTPLRRVTSATVALGLGAGLGSEDQKPVAPCHIREVDLGDHGTGLAVDVPGRRARTVIVRQEYVPLLREALELHAAAGRGTSTPLTGVKPDRRNGASYVAERAVTATGAGVEISAARLRSTWLVACMSSPVPLGALLHASGLTTPRTLTDLLPYCPEPDPEEVAAVLRSLGRVPAASEGADAEVSS